MKTRALYLAVVVILVSLVVAVALYFKEEAEPRTIYVPDDYSTIQRAVSKAAPGSTIIVRDGTYQENVNVDKRLTIKSENGSAGCIVVALHADDYVFRVAANYVNITGFAITRVSWPVCLSSVEHCNVSDNEVANNLHGIILGDSNNNTLMNNTVSSNHGDGIYLRGSSNMLLGNIICNNTQYGIFTMVADGNMFVDNAVKGNGIGIELDGSNSNVLRHNTVIGNCIGIVPHGKNNLIYDNYLNNTAENAWDSVVNTTWNITRTAGTNIIGGPYLGGNCWSDYAGIDTDGDGLGDTLLPHNGDYLPLVPPSGEGQKLP